MHCVIFYIVCVSLNEVNYQLVLLLSPFDTASFEQTRTAL